MRRPNARLFVPGALLCLFALRPAAKAAGGPGILAPARAANVFFNPVPLNVYGGFYSLPLIPPSNSYLGSYWWAGPNAGDDPRQAGYNPSAGYPWDSVTTLLLTAQPLGARVTLDGSDIGPARDLGPIQLPMGEHTLRVEAPGFEASETVLKVEQPIVQQLDVRLTPVKMARSAAAANEGPLRPPPRRFRSTIPPSCAGAASVPPHAAAGRRGGLRTAIFDLNTDTGWNDFAQDDISFVAQEGGPAPQAGAGLKHTKGLAPSIE